MGRLKGKEAPVNSVDNYLDFVSSLILAYILYRRSPTFAIFCILNLLDALSIQFLTIFFFKKINETFVDLLRFNFFLYRSLVKYFMIMSFLIERKEKELNLWINYKLQLPPPTKKQILPTIISSS